MHVLDLYNYKQYKGFVLYLTKKVIEHSYVDTLFIESSKTSPKAVSHGINLNEQHITEM